MLTLQSKVNEKAECSNINIGLRGNFYSGFRAYWVYVMKLLFHEDMNLSIWKVIVFIKAWTVQIQIWNILFREGRNFFTGWWDTPTSKLSIYIDRWTLKLTVFAIQKPIWCLCMTAMLHWIWVHLSPLSRLRNVNKSFQVYQRHGSVLLIVLFLCGNRNTAATFTAVLTPVMPSIKLRWQLAMHVTLPAS